MDGTVLPWLHALLDRLIETSKAAEALAEHVLPAVRAVLKRYLTHILPRELKALQTASIRRRVAGTPEARLPPLEPPPEPHHMTSGSSCGPPQPPTQGGTAEARSLPPPPTVDSQHKASGSNSGPQQAGPAGGLKLGGLPLAHARRSKVWQETWGTIRSLEGKSTYCVPGAGAGQLLDLDELNCLTELIGELAVREAPLSLFLFSQHC